MMSSAALQINNLCNCASLIFTNLPRLSVPAEQTFAQFLAQSYNRSRRSGRLAVWIDTTQAVGQRPERVALSLGNDLDAPCP